MFSAMFLHRVSSLWKPSPPRYQQSRKVSPTASLLLAQALNLDNDLCLLATVSQALINDNTHHGHSARLLLLRTLSRIVSMFMQWASQRYSTHGSGADTGGYLLSSSWWWLLSLNSLKSPYHCESNLSR